MISRLFCGFILVSIGFSSGVELPPTINKCYQNDRNVNKCLQESVNSAIPLFSKGIPELRTKPLEPLFFKHIDSSFADLKLTFFNTTLKGISKARVTKFQVDTSKNSMPFKISFDFQPLVTGKYKANGKLLLINIQGEGDCILKIGLSHCVMTFKHKFHKKGNEKFAIAEKDGIKCELGKGPIRFNKLFGENKLLGDTINTVLNDNFDLIMVEAAQPVLNAIQGRVLELMQKIYDKIPFEEIFPGKPSQS